MTSPSFFLSEDRLAGHQKKPIQLVYKITGAKTGAFIQKQPNAIVVYDTGDSSQTAVDALLNSTNEFVYPTAFGATALGTDALGIILNCQGQIRYNTDCSVKYLANVGGTMVSGMAQGQITALPNTLATLGRMQVSSLGNVALQLVIAGLDAATTGLVEIELLVDLI